MAGSTDGGGDSTSGPASDLFSEIHLNELQKLEKKLEGSEFEKGQLDASLKESKDTLDKLTVCLASQVLLNQGDNIFFTNLQPFCPSCHLSWGEKKACDRHSWWFQ